MSGFADDIRTTNEIAWFDGRKRFEEEIMKRIKFDKITFITIAVLFAFALSLIPIIYAGLFAHPVMDDYGFSASVHHAVTEHRSILKAIAQTVVKCYRTWQGTYSAVALFSIQPSAFSPSLYFLTTIIMLGCLSGATFFLFDTIIRKWFRGRKAYVVLLTCLTLTMSIQFVPDVNEAFFWFNGAAYYTLFYSFALVLAAMLIRAELKENFSVPAYILMILLCIFIGGGNYTTALVSAEILALVTAAAVKNKKANRWRYLGLFAVLIVSLLVSAVAPGNAVRARAVTGMNPIKAVLASIFYAFVKAGEWTRLPQIVFAAAVGLISFALVPELKFRFRWPLTVIGVAFLLFASQMTPPLYAMSSLGSGRQIDIYYYSYCLLLCFSVVYLCGWAYQLLMQENRESVQSAFSVIGRCLYRYLITVSVLLFAVWCMGCYSSLLSMTSLQTLKAAKDGVLTEYDREYEEIVSTLTSGERDVEPNDIETVPPFLTSFDLSDDENYWVNRQMADYYGLESIKLS